MASRSAVPFDLGDGGLPTSGCPDQHLGMTLEENQALVRGYYEDVLTGRNRRLLEQLLAPTDIR